MSQSGRQNVKPGMPAWECLDALASRVERLAPSRRDPEAFHIEKSDVAYEMRALAKRIMVVTR